MRDRVIFTPEAPALVRSLKTAHGPLIFHLSGGCCEGSAPMCLSLGGFRPGGSDILLGEVEGCPFYVGAAQYEYWAPYQIIVDVTEGGGDSFSLEAADGLRFTALSRALSREEAAEPTKAGTTRSGAEAAALPADRSEFRLSER